MAFKIYIISVLGNIGTVFSVVLLVAFGCLCTLSIVYVVGRADDDLDKQERSELRGLIKRLCVGVLITILPALLIPDTKTLTAMLVVPAIIESPAMREVPKELLNILDAVNINLRDVKE